MPPASGCAHPNTHCDLALLCVSDGADVEYLIVGIEHLCIEQFGQLVFCKINFRVVIDACCLSFYWLFDHLSSIYLLLDGAARYQSIDNDVPILTDSVDSIGIYRWIPVRVIDNRTIRGSQFEIVGTKLASHQHNLYDWVLIECLFFLAMPSKRRKRIFESSNIFPMIVRIPFDWPIMMHLFDSSTTIWFINFNMTANLLDSVAKVTLFILLIVVIWKSMPKTVHCLGFRSRGFFTKHPIPTMCVVSCLQTSGFSFPGNR